MSATIGRMLKRQKYPVKQDGELVAYVRALTHREDRAILELLKTEPSAAGGLMFCFGLLQDDGSQEFTRAEGEGDAAFGNRALEQLQDVPGDVLALVAATIKQLDIPPEMERLKKS